MKFHFEVEIFSFWRGVWVHAFCYCSSRYIFICCLIYKRYVLRPVLSESNVYLSMDAMINIKMHPAFVVVTVEDDGVACPTVIKEKSNCHGALIGVWSKQYNRLNVVCKKSHHTIFGLPSYISVKMQYNEKYFVI